MSNTELPAFVAELEEIKNRAENEDSKPVKFAMQAAFEHEICKHGPALLALVRQLQGERAQLQSRIDQASADLSSVYADVERWVVSGTNEAEIPIERVHSAIHKAIFSLEKEGDRDV